MGEDAACADENAREVLRFARVKLARDEVREEGDPA